MRFQQCQQQMHCLLTSDDDYLISEPFDYQNDGYWTSSSELPNSFSTQDKNVHMYLGGGTMQLISLQ